MDRVAEGLRNCEDALAALEALMPVQAHESRAAVRLAAALWLKRGHLLELSAPSGGGEAVLEALRGYDRAILLLRSFPSEANGVTLAGAWLNRGNALQRLGSEAARAEAVNSYDSAIALFEPVIAASGTPDPLDVAALGAAWLNRGAACRSGSGASARAEAVKCYERAIIELGPVAAAHPAARRNLSAAWTNLGLVRLEGGDARGALAAHEKALALAGSEAGANEASALKLHLGQARRAVGDLAPALEILREVIEDCASREAADLSAADLGLRARHAACVVLGEQLAAEGEEVSASTHERLAEAAALVAAGLALARAPGVASGRTLEPATRLFEFGAWLYQTFGEGQLAPFLLAELEPVDARRIEIARAAVGRARQQIIQRGFGRLAGEAAERAAAEFAGLRAVDERLREATALVAGHR
jgi:tetratricopeptide (TPR) repeat protein